MEVSFSLSNIINIHTSIIIQRYQNEKDRIKTND
jgi:hypothetical protein